MGRHQLGLSERNTGYTPELTNSQVIAGTGGVGIDLGVFPPARTVTVGMDLTF